MKLQNLACTVACVATSGLASCTYSPPGAAPASPSPRGITTIRVQADQPGAAINPAMWGAFFEDINFGADGGLYAELVKNRGFEFPDPLMGWITISPSLTKGEVTVLSDDPAPALREANPHYVHIASRAAPPLGISNEGFRGFGLKAGEAYDFSVQARGELAPRGRLTVELVASDGTTLAESDLTGLSKNWGRLTATLKPRETDPHARLNIIVQGAPGTVDLDWVSLFPQNTWKHRPGGLRADMVQRLADLHPGFLRFPGGCVVEGSDLAKRYQWKNTIGPVEGRKLLLNRWNNEFKHRPTPDYYQSFGLGFYEYFQLCEDIGAQPLPIINCGMACQFNSAELCAPADQQQYIQDALDLIEFANGPAESPWGARRAAMGHPAPFHMKMMGVGNEQWGPDYLQHLAAFTQAIKAKYPDIQLVSDAGPSPSDERFEFLWPKLRQMHADIVDEHCYANPIWFLSNTTRFDPPHYDRAGPKVFFGEYAAQSVAIVSPRNRNTMECALSEAAYMTGMERNADLVRMASYAPLFSNADAWQWTPDLLWVNSLQTVGTPNYYVQQMYATNRGDTVLPTTNDAPAKEILPRGRVGVGTWAAWRTDDGAAAEFKDLRITRAGQTQPLAGWAAAGAAPPTPSSAPGHGWQLENGLLRQTDEHAGESLFAGDPAWTDCILTLKARKLSGQGGLAITVCDDGQGARAQWILGGWGNAQHGIVTHYAEQDQLLERVPGSLETGRWYEVKVEVRGATMSCYLDGKLVQQREILRRRVPGLFTSAVRDQASGETILKVVNPGTSATSARIDLRGASVAPTAKSIVLAGDPSQENTFAHPDAIVPQTRTITNAGATFDYTFPSRSFTILRLKTRTSGN